MRVEYDITPIPKPRMTHRDKWANRDVVKRYHAFKDECRLKKVILPEEGAHVIFVMPMPKSWTIEKRQQMEYMPHIVRPDVDNMAKALMDAVFPDDSGVWDIRVTKVWGKEGKIIIYGKE